MPLLADHLTVWEIAFRWANRDPSFPWPWLPLDVRDHFRNLTGAILSAELSCLTISLEKRHFEPEDRIFSIYHWLDDISLCRAGQRYNRKLFRHALIEREDLKLWCERMNAPLPEFWFPPGWNFEYNLPDDDVRPGHAYMRLFWTDDHWEARDSEQAELCDSLSDGQAPKATASETAADKLRPNQEAKIACQQIARALWKENPDRHIGHVAKDELIQKYGGGNCFVPETVEGWIKSVAPPHVRNRRGRPRKNGDESE